MLGGCALSSQTTLQSGSSSMTPGGAVAVLSDFTMDSFEEADALADRVRLAMSEKNYKVVVSEYEADLIVIPALGHAGSDRMESVEIERPARSPALQASVFGRRMLHDLPPPPEGNGPDAIMITALTRQTWFEITDGQTDIPFVWRIVGRGTADKSRLIEQALSKIPQPETLLMRKEQISTSRAQPDA